jgi:hypothetical protein
MAKKQPRKAKGAKAGMSLIGAIVPAVSPGSLISAAVQRQRPPATKKLGKRGRGRG